MDKKRIRFVLELLVNFALPWLVYTWAKQWGEVTGLIASAVPPMLWSIVELLRTRHLDALSMIVLGGIALSLIAMLLGGSPRMLLVRESLISGLIGVVFLFSVWWRKPLIYYLAHATVARERSDGVEDFEDWFEQPDSLRRVRVMTGVWGVGLTAEALIKCWLAWNWTPSRFLALSPFISYGMIGAIVVWTIVYRRSFKEVAEQ